MTRQFIFIILSVLLLSSIITEAGPVAYMSCQSACNAGWVKCYAVMGLVAGTITGGIGAPAGAITCNVAQAACMASCAVLLLAPTL
ncbi:13786_t:CDS:2 [Cetraspora pellucida]|uniref:13786_t:CDS:1 n=1 Tax=Cetraspora pellucida TaxID=1433469 RepID=A0A9N9FNK6_9GLOM|nr:13786_t:CDS:2 [Cetraspora pellucida]